MCSPELVRSGGAAPICVHTSSISAPMNCGVALVPSASVSLSTILPMLYQSAAL